MAVELPFERRSVGVLLGDALLVMLVRRGMGLRG
jgi:hypothetical protein